MFETTTDSEVLAHLLATAPGPGWEDRFADMYAAYAEWYFKQDKLEEAAAKVQAGLDHAPRNQGLLDEQTKIENAQNGSEGD